MSERTRKPWQPLEIMLLQAYYPDVPTQKIADDLKRSRDQVYRKAHALGLKKSAAFLASEASGRMVSGRHDGRGSSTRWKKGDARRNTDPSALIRAGVRTRFQKGFTPPRKVPVGTVVTATIGYLKKKVAEPNIWAWLHKLDWEAVHGPVPPGMCLFFKDGNRLNCDVANLELITRQELSARSRQKYPPDLLEAMKLATRLRNTIKNLEGDQVHDQ